MTSSPWIPLFAGTELSGTLTVLTFTCLLKGMIRDTDEKPYEEIHRARSGRVLSTRASVPVELGCVTPLECEHVHQQKVL